MVTLFSLYVWERIGYLENNIDTHTQKMMQALWVFTTVLAMVQDFSIIFFLVLYGG
jgi:hypothetical protein